MDERDSLHFEANKNTSTTQKTGMDSSLSGCNRCQQTFLLLKNAPSLRNVILLFIRIYSTQACTKITIYLDSVRHSVLQAVTVTPTRPKHSCPLASSHVSEQDFRVHQHRSAATPDLWPPCGRKLRKNFPLFFLCWCGWVKSRRQPWGWGCFQSSEYQISQTKREGRGLAGLWNLLELFLSAWQSRMRRDRWNSIDSTYTRPAAGTGVVHTGGTYYHSFFSHCGKIPNPWSAWRTHTHTHARL